MTPMGRSAIERKMARGWLLAALFLFLPLPAFPAEAAEIVCVQCHGSLPGKLGAPVRLWKGSIHAENGVACNHCHGGDPKDAANAMSPARGFMGAPRGNDIPAFCGRCHVGVKNNYLASAHGRALGKGGPTCVACHGNHLVVKASLGLINESNCARCHSFERARLLKSAMEHTETLLVAMEGRINSFKGEGADTDREEKGLFALRNRFHTLSHELDVEKVGKESSQINNELKRLDTVLQGMSEVRWKRKIAGAAAVCGALLVALLFHLLKKSYD